MQKGLSNHFFPAVDGTSFHFDAGAGGDITILPVVAPCTNGTLCIFVVEAVSACVASPAVALPDCQSLQLPQSPHRQ